MPYNDQQQWHSFGLSDTGVVRDHNEDAFLALAEQSLWAVADGMGGYESGEVASNMIIDGLRNFRAGPLFGLNINWLIRKLQLINRDLLALARRNNTSVIGSTAALLFVQQHYCACLWAGDSRIYRVRDGRLQQVTRDHSHQQELQDMGYTLQEIAQFPDAQAITRAVGADDLLEIECRVQEIKYGDMFLLCSDGLYKELSEPEIAAILTGYPLEQGIKEMLQRCLQRGARDNVTLIGVS